MFVHSKLIVLLLLFPFGDCAKILGLFVSSVKSHFILGSSLMKELASRGHEVTIIAAYEEKSIPENVKYKQILVPEVITIRQEIVKEQNLTVWEVINLNCMKTAVYTQASIQLCQEAILANKEVQNLLLSNETFDLVIVEQFVNDVQKLFARHFNAPLVIFSTMATNYWVNSLTGNPSPPSYIPHLFTDYSFKMTFFERIKNTLMRLFNILFFHGYGLPKDIVLGQQYFPKISFQEALYNISLVLINSHNSINIPVPLLPNMIEIGGFHIKASKNLSANLQILLDNAKKGVIYFSFGSRLKSSTIPPNRKYIFSKLFSLLEQTVLWKFEDDNLMEKPENVKIFKWLPQQDILAHPNVKLFISHGGLLSISEAIKYGVPMLIIPITADQTINAEYALYQGFGLKIPFNNISVENLLQSVQHLLNNYKLKQSIEKRSKLFCSKIIDPVDLAIYWIEYVLRHPKAHHLRSVANDLSLFTYYLIDIILLSMIVSIMSVFALYNIITFLYVKLINISN